MSLSHACLPSPLGTLTLVWDGAGLRRLCWPGQVPPPGSVPSASGHPALDALRAWFMEGTPLPRLPLAPAGTPFQQAAWQAMAGVPAGSTLGYAALATRAGLPASAVRAVAAAVGRNPLPVLLPCHRIVGSNGHLTGFSGGLAAKRWLLAHEGVALAADGLRLA